MVLRMVKNKTFSVHTDCLFDSRQKKFVQDTTIIVDPETGLIVNIYRREDTLPATISETDIDLRGKCVLPGLVDAHTHIFLHPYSETASLNQERDESIVERTIRATNHCRAALLAGFTTYRDLGNESAGDADVHVRNAVNRGLIPGPRIFCATEPLASSGGYEIRIESRINGVHIPRLADACDGVAGVRAGVRRRLGAGADIVKFYADYRKRTLRFPEVSWTGEPDIQHAPGWRGLYNDRNPSLPLFNQEEADEIVREARAARAPVAAHAQCAEAVTIAAKAGVTSIEHGFEPWEGTKALQAIKENNVIFVPTLSVLEDVLKRREHDFAKVCSQTKTAFDAGVKIAAGGDTGAVPHGENARELELLLRAGMPLKEVLVAATLHGWEACGGDWSGRRFGSLEKGFAADIVALDGDVRDDVGALRRVGFVMKDGKVWKRDGRAVGMI